MEINKWLRYFIWAGVFVVTLVPVFVFNSSFFPFITSKNFVFRVIVEIIFGAWLLLAYRDKKARPDKSYLLWSVLALTVVAGLATFFGVNPYKSFWSNFERMDGYITILHLLAYFLVLISVFKTKTLWSWLVNFSLLTNLYIIYLSLGQLTGARQIYQSSDRLEASFGNAAYLAVYVLIYFFLLLYLFAHHFSYETRKKVLWPLWYLPLAGLNLIVLYYTATRGAQLGLLGGLFLVALTYAFFASGRSRVVAGVCLLGLVILGGSFWTFRESEFVQSRQVLSRLASISLQDGTTKSRLMIWQMSWQGFKERPILGWGPENYTLVFDKYYNPEMYGQEPWFDRSHNIFFDWLINAGILGLLAYLSIYLFALYYLWRLYFYSDKKSLSLLSTTAILTGLLSAYFFHNIFVFDNLVSYILFFSLVAYIHTSTVAKADEEEKKLIVKKDYKQSQDKEQQDLIFGVLMVATVLGLGATLYYFNYKPFAVSRDLIVALKTGSTQINDETATKTLEIFKEVFAKNTFGSGEAREQLVSRAFAVYSSPDVKDELKFAYARLIDEEAEKHLDLYGAEARPNLVFGSYYSSLGQAEKGLDLLRRAQEISPKKQQILFELGSVYARLQAGAEAVATLKQAYELAPQNDEARKMYALIFLMTDKRDEAFNLLAPIREQKTFFADERFLRIFEQLGDKKMVDEILAKQAEEEKNKK